MPLDASKRRRVEIPADLYNDIARDATALHMPIQTLIISMLARQLAADRAGAAVPMKDRLPHPLHYAPQGGVCVLCGKGGLAVSQEIEAELAATRKAREVK